MSRSNIQAVTFFAAFLANVAGCTSQIDQNEDQPADASACFMRAIAVCEAAGCINNQLKSCDAQLARAGLPLTDGLRSSLTQCLSTAKATAANLNNAEQWRRCMHLLEKR
jgi:hypothetical protein